MTNKVRVTVSDNADVKVKEEDRVAYPSMYDVIFLNDDFTPMDFVIHILMSLFNHDEMQAENITHRIHDHGQGVAGSYFLEIAEQKCAEATLMARQNEFPLQVKVVKHDS